MTQPDKSSRVGIRDRIRFRRQLAELKRASDAEGFKLACKVLDGEVTRAQVEAALAEYGDAEPAVALEYLDKWGVR